MEPKSGPVKVLLAQEIAPNLLDDIRNVDPRLEISVLDREMVPLFWGRPPANGETSVQQRFASLMAEAEVLYGLILSTEQARNVLAAMPELRWFQSTSAGVDELIGAGYGERGVTVTTSSGVHATPIGEFALHLMLMFAKQAARSLRSQQEKRWERFTPAELRNATVGVVGLGHIGSEVARLAKGFGCRVLAVDRLADAAGPADELLPLSGLTRMLAESDYVVLSVPLSNETRHLIGEAELRAMKPSAFLINVCRGPVVDETALIRALRGMDRRRRPRRLRAGAAAAGKRALGDGQRPHKPSYHRRHRALLREGRAHLLREPAPLSRRPPAAQHHRPRTRLLGTRSTCRRLPRRARRPRPARDAGRRPAGYR